MRNHSLLISAAAIAGIVISCSSSSDKSAGGGGASNGGSSSNAGANSKAGATSNAGATSEAGVTGSDAGASNGGSGSSEAGAAGTTGEAGEAGTGPGATGWTAIPLLDDTTAAAHKVIRSDNDLVSGIYFNSIDDGWVTTRGSQGSFGDGGAVYKAKSKSLTSILFSGNRNGLCLSGSIDFQGLDKTPDGFVALAYACDVIASHDGGKTFTIARNEPGADPLGIEQVLAMRETSTGTFMFADSGYVDTAPTAPGANADWTTVWAPEGVPPSPNPVPAADCQVMEKNQVPAERTVAYVSPTGDLMAYVAVTADQTPIVCVSKDSGKNFLPTALPGLPDDATDFAPNGVVFTSAKAGITFWANNVYPGEAYVYYTTNAGTTWKAATLPTAKSHSIDFYSAFFAPDGTHGWITGFNYDSTTALLWKTSDGGVTWVASGGDLAAKTANSGIPKLYTGFALDANHIWVGGDYGILMANDAGGE
jgi:hypothetical protein